MLNKVFFNKFSLIILSLLGLLFLLWYSNFIFFEDHLSRAYARDIKPRAFVTLAFCKVYNIKDNVFTVSMLGTKYNLIINNAGTINKNDYLTIKGYLNADGKIVCSFIHDHGNYLYFSIISFVGAFFIIVLFFKTYSFNVKKMEFQPSA
jgi:hypothetical protein